MLEKEYTPKSPGYVRKSNLIGKLSSMDRKNPKLPSTLLDLGKAASEQMRISNKQSAQLIDALNSSGILTYVDTFVNSGKNSKFVDGVRWDIELDGKLQFHILYVLYQLCSRQLPTSDQTDLLTVLLNKAYTEGFKKIDYVDTDQSDEDSVWNRGLNFLRQKDENLVKEAKKRGRQIDINTFMYEEEYDQLLTEAYINGVRGTSDIFKKFALLEEVAYLGFAMGVRGGFESEKKRWESK